MERKKISYIVKIEIGYTETNFNFRFIEPASEFMQTAIEHNAECSDRVKITLMPQFEEEKEFRR